MRPQPPRPCSAGCGTPGVYSPRSPLREPVRGATTPQPPEGHGRGRARGAVESPHARIPLRGARVPHHCGGHTQPHGTAVGRGDAPRPHPAPRPPGRGAPPNRFHRGLPVLHGGPSPPSAPAEPRGSPVLSGVRRGEVQPGLPVRLPVSVAVLGGGVTAEGRGPGVTLAVAPARPCLSFPASHSGDTPKSGWDRIPCPGCDTGPGAGSAPRGWGGGHPAGPRGSVQRGAPTTPRAPLKAKPVVRGSSPPPAPPHRGRPPAAPALTGSGRTAPPALCSRRKKNN